MKIVIITYMIFSYSLNGHAQLSSRAKSGFLLYVLCVYGWVCWVHADVQARSTLCLSPKSNEAMEILNPSFACPAMSALLLFIYKFSTAHSLVSHYWHRHKKARFGCMPITKAQTRMRIHSDWSALLFFTIGRYSIRTCTWNISVCYILCSEARQAGLSFMLL